MTDPAIEFYGRSNNLDSLTHRFFLRALGLEMIVFLSGGYATLSSKAQAVVVEGLAKQDPVSGILPERGGFDFNYQSISLTFLGRYYMFIDDVALKATIQQTILNALPSIQQRVDSLANIDLTDSTRINELRGNGKTKTIDYPNVIPAYIVAHAVINDARFDTIARMIAIPNRSTVEYRFERLETDGQKSSGTDQDEGNIFARTPANVKDLYPLGPPGSGITANADEYSYDLSSSPAMGEGPGKFARTKWGVTALDGMVSFTLVGWKKTHGGQQIGSHVQLFRTDRFRLTVLDGGYLRLFVYSMSSADAIVSTNNHWNAVGKWMYFAVWYDGTQSANNLRFYHRTWTSGVLLSSVQTLDRITVDVSTDMITTGARLYVSEQSRPFDRFLDDMRIYASKTDASGAMSQSLLEKQRVFDFKESGCAGCGVGDPHFIGFDGTKFDFHGQNDEYYLIFGSRFNESLSGTVRVTGHVSRCSKLRQGKTYFKEFGINVQGKLRAGRTCIRVYLEQVELSWWEVRVEVNGRIVSNRETVANETKVELHNDGDSVVVHTQRTVYTMHRMQLQNRERYHLDFGVALRKNIAVSDNYVGILGMTLSRRLGKVVHEDVCMKMCAFKPNRTGF